MVLRDFNPPLKYGAKITPQDIAGMIGLPYVGNIYYVDPTNGADTYGGTDPQAAFKTLTKAYNTVTDNHHDVIVIIPGGVGTGTGTVETAAITWSKNLTHLVGNVAPTMFSSRARVTTATASLSPFITISGSGNSFHNVQFTAGVSTDLILFRVSGHRNYFQNVHFANTSAVAFDTATACDLQLYGGQENYFVDCTIGADSFDKSTGSSLFLTNSGSSAAARNVFDSCLFVMRADASAPFFINVGASGMDRFLLLRKCTLLNSVGTGGTALAYYFSMNANPGGDLLLQDCMQVGSSNTAASLTNVRALGISSNGTYANGIGWGVVAGA